MAFSSFGNPSMGMGSPAGGAGDLGPELESITTEVQEHAPLLGNIY